MSECAMCAELRGERDWMRAQLALLQNSLVERTLAEARPTSLPKKEPDPVAEAIRTVSGTDAALRKHLFGWVKGERAKPEGERLTDDALVARITHWQPSDEPTVPLRTANA